LAGDGTRPGRLPALPRILAYGTAGFGIAKASASFGPFSDSDTESDFVYGLGIEGKINPSMSLRLEYLAFGDLDVDVVRAGINFKLGY
jgi:opacity protein-like surface antigen